MLRLLLPLTTGENTCQKMEEFTETSKRVAPTISDTRGEHQLVLLDSVSTTIRCMGRTRSLLRSSFPTCLAFTRRQCKSAAAGQLGQHRQPWNDIARSGSWANMFLPVHGGGGGRGQAALTCWCGNRGVGATPTASCPSSSILFSRSPMGLSSKSRERGFSA